MDVIVSFVYYNRGDEGRLIIVINDDPPEMDLKDFTRMGLELYKGITSNEKHDLLCITTSLKYISFPSYRVYNRVVEKYLEMNEGPTKKQLKDIIGRLMKINKIEKFPAKQIRFYDFEKNNIPLENGKKKFRIAIKKLNVMFSVIQIFKQHSKQRVKLKFKRALRMMDLISDLSAPLVQKYLIFRKKLSRRKWSEIIKKIRLMSKVVTIFKEYLFKRISQRKMVVWDKFNIPLDCSFPVTTTLWMLNDLEKSQLLKEFILKTTSFVGQPRYHLDQPIDIVFHCPTLQITSNIFSRIYLFSIHLDNMSFLPDDVFKIIIAYITTEPSLRNILLD